ncbi:MAG: hypothetical protein ACI4HM_03565, partial [Ruminococcus sp.]
YYYDDEDIVGGELILPVNLNTGKIGDSVVFSRYNFIDNLEYANNHICYACNDISCDNGRYEIKKVS